MAYKRRTGASHAGMFASQILIQLVPHLTSRFRRWRAGGVAFGPAAPITNDFAKQILQWGIKQQPMMVSRSTRDTMLRVLVKLHYNFMIYRGGEAALHGLEFTQPFHDKRVIELALAIPDEFHVHNGRQRFLAITALKDVLPPAFQSRGKDNHQVAPDSADMIEPPYPKSCPRSSVWRRQEN